MPAGAEHEERPLATGLRGQETAQRRQFVVAEQHRVDRPDLVVADERHRRPQVRREAARGRDGRRLKGGPGAQRRRVLGAARGELPDAELGREQPLLLLRNPAGELLVGQRQGEALVDQQPFAAEAARDGMRQPAQGLREGPGDGPALAGHPDQHGGPALRRRPEEPVQLGRGDPQV